MRYSLERIGTVQACDTLLARAREKKQSLERRRRNLGEKIDIFRRRMDKIYREMEVTRVSLDAFTAASLAMPDGKHKMSMVIKVKQLEIQLIVLQRKALVYHVNALLDKEVKYMMLDNQVLVMEQYIATVETRSATLSQPVSSVRQVPAVSTPVAEASDKTENVIPDLTAWRTVIDAFLNTGVHGTMTSGRLRTIGKLE
jgi:hypothetical protein